MLRSCSPPTTKPESDCIDNCAFDVDAISARRKLPGSIPAIVSADVAEPCNFNPETFVEKFNPTLIVEKPAIAFAGVNAYLLKIATNKSLTNNLLIARPLLFVSAIDSTTQPCLP